MKTSNAVLSVPDSTGTRAKASTKGNHPVLVGLESTDTTAELIEVGKRIAAAFERIATALEHKASAV
jgi:phosphopantothenate synthetase